MISLAQAFAQWQELAADIPKDDEPMLSESWNDYTDSLAKDGELCALQYHYAPAWDDHMPGEGSRFDPLEADRDYILAEMGVTMRTTRVEARPDAEEWDASASHWRCTIRRRGARAARALSVPFSMGSARTGEPELCDVLGCVLRDAESAADTFGDFCDELGLDEDSRKAERMFRACKRTGASLLRLFSACELADLRELFEGM